MGMHEYSLAATEPVYFVFLGNFKYRRIWNGNILNSDINMTADLV
jgi:hypothetical protein